MVKIIYGIIFFLVSSLASASSQQAEILYRSSGITTTDDGNCKIIDGHIEYHDSSVPSANAIIDSEAHAYNRSGKVNENIYNTGNCYFGKTAVKVAAHGWFVQRATSYLTAAFTRAGNYPLLAITSAGGRTATGNAAIYIR